MKENSSTLDKFTSQKEEEGFTDYFSDIREVSSGTQKDIVRIDFNTAYQAVLAEQIVKKIRDDLQKVFKDPKEVSKLTLLDCGSKFSEVLSFSKYFKTVFTECRNGVEPNAVFKIPGLDISLLNSEAQKLESAIVAESISVVTSLHAVEHFGLGRYGDTIDYFGDQKGLKSFNKILKLGGTLVLSVPFSIHDSPRIEFNSQRVYNYKTVEKMLDKSGFKILDEWFILPLGSLRTSDNKNETPVLKNRAIIDSLDETETTRESVGVYLTVCEKIKNLDDLPGE